MTVHTNDLGGRLPLVDPATLTPAQQEFFDATANQYPRAQEAGVQLKTEDGRLIGPLNAFLRRPEISAQFLEYLTAERRTTSLSPQVREVVILAVGSAWDAEYEVYAHQIFGIREGISREGVEILARGGLPDELSREAKLAHRVARQLTIVHGVDDELYQEALDAFGEEGLFDITALMGVYLTLSTILTLFSVPAPE